MPIKYKIAPDGAVKEMKKINVGYDPNLETGHRIAAIRIGDPDNPGDTRKYRNIFLLNYPVDTTEVVGGTVLEKETNIPLTEIP